MLKKIIATGLSLAIIAPTCCVPSLAWVPRDYKDPKCIDIRKLGNETDSIHKEGRICGCSTCTVDAVAYNKLGDYADYLENRFNEIAKKEYYIENGIKIRQVKGILENMADYIDTKEYKDKNFFFASTNYDLDYSGISTFFAEKGDMPINESYDESYFEQIKTKMKEVDNKISEYLKTNKGKYKLYDYSDQNKLMAATILIPTLVTGIMMLPINIYFKKKYINKFLELLKNAPDSVKKTYQKRINEKLKKEIELNEENLKKLSLDFIEKMLDDLKSEVEQDD